MINQTLLLLSPFEDCSTHHLSKYVGYLRLSVPFAEAFYEPAQRIFSRVILYDYLKRMLEVGIREMNKEIVDLVRTERPECVLWLAFGEYYEIMESTFKAARKEGSLVTGWFFDDEVRFDYYSKWWIPHLDFIITNDLDAVPKYGELGAWVTHAVPDTGDATEIDWSNIREKYDVSFVGSMRADRQQYLETLKEHNIPVTLFGEAGGNFVSYSEMRNIFATSRINLNFSKTYQYMKLGLKGRVFKVCLAGGFLLTEYFPGIESYFEIDREIVCFRDKEEMMGKVRYYLDHDDERRAIARAGWQRVAGEYTAFHIMARVFQEIEEDVAANGKLPGSPLPRLRMPWAIRKRVSDFYYKWGIAFSTANHRNFWRESFLLALAYNPFRARVLCYYLIGFLPSSLRLPIIRLYERLFA